MQTRDAFPVPPTLSAAGRAQMLTRRYAPGPFSVLVTGEPGVGKTLVAETLHRLSGRSGRLVRYSSANRADTLLGDDLRGHERGAFTGAVAARAGCVEEAHGGTLFIDELHRASPDLLEALLDISDGKPIRRLGGSRDLIVDVKLVFATSAEPHELRQAHRLPIDLLHRIGLRHIRVPPLRERPEEILPLAKLFLVQALHSLSRPYPPVLSPELERVLRSHPWPGNVRQLKDAMDTAATGLDYDRPASLDDLPDLDMYERPTSPPVEAADLRDVIAAAGGNKREAARRLRISPTTLHRRLRLQEGDNSLPD